MLTMIMSSIRMGAPLDRKQVRSDLGKVGSLPRRRKTKESSAGDTD